MASEMMRVRIKSGPNAFSFVVEDMDTGKLLPALAVELRYGQEEMNRWGMPVAAVLIEVHEVDVETEAAVREEIRQIEEHGGTVRIVPKLVHERRPSVQESGDAGGQ